MEEVYDARWMPLSSNPEKRAAQEKFLKGEPLTLKEKLLLPGHDHPIKQIGEYALKPDHCYRAVSKETLALYLEKGYIVGLSEYLGEVTLEDGSKRVDNGGVDWYLGGVSKRYGEMAIECKADKNYFVPAFDYGCGLSEDLFVRHMKSSGIKNPIPVSMITNIFDIKTEKRIPMQEEIGYKRK